MMVDRESRYKKPESKKEDAPKETKEAASKAEATAAEPKGEGGDGAQKTSGETPATTPVAEMGGDGAPGMPDVGEVSDRHTRERGDMNKRHVRERGDAADRHEAEHKDMSKRHEKELVDFMKNKMAAAPDAGAGAEQQGA